MTEGFVFRILALALLPAVCGGLPGAIGQNAPPVPSAQLGVLRCSAQAVAPIVRSEGASELVGDVLITCHNSAPAARFEPRGFVEADLAVTFDVGVANRVGFGMGVDVTDAVLVVNEKHCAAPDAARSFTDCGTGSAAVQDPQLGLRDAFAPNMLRWPRVAVPIPGAAIGTANEPARPLRDCTDRFGQRGGCHPMTTTIRLTNLRVDAAQLAAAGGSGRIGLPIRAALSLRSADALVLLQDSQVRVASVAPGIHAVASDADVIGLCSRGDAMIEVTVAEGFAYAFKGPGRPRNRVGEPGWEAWFYPIAPPGEDSGYSLPATRLRVSFAGLPAGVQVSAPSRLSCSEAAGAGQLELGLVEGAGPSGFGGSVSSGRAVPSAIGTLGEPVASAVYEVLGSDPLVSETCRIPFEFARSAGGQSVLEAADVAVTATLVPTVSRSGLAGSGAVPAFVDLPPASRQSVRLERCGTALFFPFVTSRSNFDTAIVISNTSADPLGSRHQAGTCTLRYRGQGGAGGLEPQRIRTVSVAAGGNLAFTLSGGNPTQGVQAVSGFQGYLVAECSFQHAMGFAFVTEQQSGAAILAQGYLAEVLRDPPSTGSVANQP